MNLQIAGNSEKTAGSRAGWWTSIQPSDQPSVQRLLGKRAGIWLAVALLLACNPHLWGGGYPESLVFLPAAVKDGDWWRVFTHPLVHVSWWQLLLDGAAFLLLWSGLEAASVGRRLLWVAGCGTGSLAVSLLSSTTIYTEGLCGLSGIAHGLTAIYGLELARAAGRDRTLHWLGLGCFAAVVAKSVGEALLGEVLFGFLHLGSVGTPVAVCHAGGVLGGLVAWVALGRLLHPSAAGHAKWH